MQRTSQITSGFSATPLPTISARDQTTAPGFAAEVGNLPSALPAVPSIEKLLPRLDGRSAAVVPASEFNSPLAVGSASEPASGADEELGGLGTGRRLLSRWAQERVPGPQNRERAAELLVVF